MQLTRNNLGVKKTSKEKILQFGEGNFLRAFVDWMFNKLNTSGLFEGSIVMVQPIENGLADLINEQEGLYTLYMRGIEEGKVQTNKELISCVSRVINPYKAYNEYLETAENPEIKYIVSNTTESGIAFNENDCFDAKPQVSFPGKLTAWLHRRFKSSAVNKEDKLIILPCELIEQNGSNLKDVILKLSEKWSLGEDFVAWINRSLVFCNTLVDRIVPGFPKDRIAEIQTELGYKDSLVVESELFHLWVIEGPAWIENELPFGKAGLNVIFTDNQQPYRTRKVRILNGAHTSTLPVAYLLGHKTVRESVEDSRIEKYLNQVLFEEVIPTLDMPKEELELFANEVISRFKNPYIQHYWMSIALNSISKFTTRVLPSLLGYYTSEKKLPSKLVFSLSALLYFYRGQNKEEVIQLNDSDEILTFFKKVWSNFDGSEESLGKIIPEILKKKEYWKTDLNEVLGLEKALVKNIVSIHKNGMEQALKSIS